MLTYNNFVKLFLSLLLRNERSTYFRVQCCVYYKYVKLVDSLYLHNLDAWSSLNFQNRLFE